LAKVVGEENRVGETTSRRDKKNKGEIKVTSYIWYQEHFKGRTGKKKEETRGKPSHVKPSLEKQNGDWGGDIAGVPHKSSQ